MYEKNEILGNFAGEEKEAPFLNVGNYNCFGKYKPIRPIIIELQTFRLNLP